MSFSISTDSYKPKTTDANAQAFADTLPKNKKLWATFNIQNTVNRSILQAISQEMIRYQNLLYQVVTEYIPNFEDSFIERWEKLLGIPDSCFNNTGSDDERRRNIIIKLAYMNLQTPQDYYNLAELLDLNIEIYYYQPLGSFTYTFPFRLEANNFRFIWYININDQKKEGFPFTFPLTFGTGNSSLFQCICQKQKPANTELIFTFDPSVYSTDDGYIYVTNDGQAYETG